MPPRAKRAAANAAPPPTPEIDPATGLPRVAEAAANAAPPPPSEIDPATGLPRVAEGAPQNDGVDGGDTETETAVETNPFDPVTQSGQWTKWQLDREEQFPVLVPAPNKKKDPGRPVKIACVNGVAYWAQYGVQKLVPISVARIAFEAELSVLPVPGAVTPSFTDGPPPELKGAPSDAATEG